MMTLLQLAFIQILLFNAVAAPDLKEEVVKVLTEAANATEKDVAEMKKVVPIPNEAVRKLDQIPNEIRALLKGKSHEEISRAVQDKWNNEIDPLIDQIPLPKPDTEHQPVVVNELIAAQQHCETQQACDQNRFKSIWAKFKNDLKQHKSEKAQEKALSQITHLRRFINLVLNGKDSQKGRKRVKRAEAIAALPFVLVVGSIVLAVCSPFIIIYLIVQIVKVFFCLIVKIPGLPGQPCDSFWLMT